MKRARSASDGSVCDRGPIISTLRVLDPGLYTLRVDLGRSGCRSLGVPVGGAADRAALILGNALVGNPPGAAALEISLAGPTLATDGPIAGVVFGAPFEVRSDRQRLTAGTTFTLQSGERLTVGGTRERMRAYLCVHGGFEVQPVLDSRSAFEPTRAGDVLTCRAGSIRARFIRREGNDEGEPGLLRVVDGTQADWFRAEEFHEQEFIVTPASNRMGLRLQGRPLTLPKRELVSEPVCPGSVQVTSDGQCIVLGVDGQTIGGYPKIAQVIGADSDRLGQLRPGERVRFRRVSLEEAEALHRRKEADLREWLTRLRTTAEVVGEGEPAPRGLSPLTTALRAPRT